MHILLIFLLTISASLAVDSPNKLYSTTTEVDEFNVRSLVIKKIKKDNETIFTTSSGYGGFQEIIWSSNSRYLAVVDHGIKTMMTLAIYEVSVDNVTEIPLPDYHLNILGRFNLFEGGRYWFDDQLTWKDNILTFETSGSLKDGVSNPKDDPNNWYKYSISMRFGGKNTAAQPRLVKVENLSKTKPIKMQNKSQ